MSPAKYSTGRLFNLGEMSCFNQHNAQFNEFEYHFACRRKVVHLFSLFYHESWQNDICSFRAMTVALAVSFKLISF